MTNLSQGVTEITAHATKVTNAHGDFTDTSSFQEDATYQYSVEKAETPIYRAISTKAIAKEVTGISTTSVTDNPGM